MRLCCAQPPLKAVALSTELRADSHQFYRVAQARQTYEVKAGPHVELSEGMDREVLMARQPICDARGQVFGYELLYRSKDVKQGSVLDDATSARSLVHSLIDIGLDTLVGNRIAFINIPTSILLSSTIELLPPGRVVLELLETMQPTQEVRYRLEDLIQLGYTFALDDFTFMPEQVDLLDYARIVKVDVLALNAANHRTYFNSLQRKGVKLLAEKVETELVFKEYAKLNFNYFQGYYFARPKLMRGKAAKSSTAALMRIVSQILNPETTVSEIEHLIGSDVALVYRVLKLINSAALNSGRRVESVREAVFMLGVERISALASLLLLSEANTGPSELINMALVRANMCERLARSLGYEAPHKHFTVGLFSMLEAIVDQPIEEIMNGLPVSDRITDILTGAETRSELARTLIATTAFECGNFAEAAAVIGTSNHLQSAYESALHIVGDVSDLAA